MSRRDQRRVNRYFVAYGGQAVYVSARTRGAAVHRAFRQFKEPLPRSTSEGWWRGVSIELVG